MQVTVPESVEVAAIELRSKADGDNAMGMLKRGMSFDSVGMAITGMTTLQTRQIYRMPTNQKWETAALALPVGKYTPPLEVARGVYAMFKVKKHTPKMVKEHKEVWSDLRDELMVLKGQARGIDLAQEIERFRQSAKIDIRIPKYRKILTPPKATSELGHEME